MVLIFSLDFQVLKKGERLMKYFTKEWCIDNKKQISTTPEMKELEKQIAQFFLNGFDKDNPWSEEFQKLQNAYNRLLCDENEDIARCQKTAKDYWDYFKQIEPFLPNCIKQIHNLNIGMSMHDSKVVNSNFIGKDFCIYIDPSGGYCDVTKLIFVNAEILESELNLNNKNWWIYNEVYFYKDCKGRYEMHILFDVEDEIQNIGKSEMIIVFDDIIINDNYTAGQ